MNAWWPEAVCLVAAIGLEVTGSSLQKYGATAAYDPSRDALAALVYFRVGMTLFRFLLFRGVWRLAIVLLVDGALFLGPLLVFTDQLWAARTKGLVFYTGLAARYATEFEARWTGDNVPAGESLLGTADIQSLADLANAVSVVNGMRWITIGPRLLTMITIAAVAPLTPLLLFRYPIAELAEQFFSKLIGL